MTETTDHRREAPQIILVTGVSGAGKSSALKALEDLGYEAIDNVPVSLLDRLVGPGDFETHTAIGIDIRTRDFDADAVLAKIAGITTGLGTDIEPLFLDCEDEILVRRYEETRRRHPLAQDRPVSYGIHQERQLLLPLRERSTVLIDTSEMALGDLKRTLEGHFGLKRGAGLSVFISSFGYKNGLPRDADLVFDVRFLKNPYYDLALRPLNGKDQRVADHILKDPGFEPFFDHLTDLLGFLLERYEKEGKSYLTIAIGCTGGQHRSVYTAERLVKFIEDKNYLVQVRHRDLEKEKG
ncbi:MAG: RNase adapter RapZ [Rhodospirillales bacterium]|nr:RNase adapter RapZ [Rhodospirillales bacterium]